VQLRRAIVDRDFGDGDAGGLVLQLVLQDRLKRGGWALCSKNGILAAIRASFRRTGSFRIGKIFDQ
jgi:hypothetical protein